MTLSLDALCVWLERQGVAKLKWPERLVPIAEMPMTPTRKVIKSALAALLRE
jgi:cyclohexanecarboxylate-CoA ligase